MKLKDLRDTIAFEAKLNKSIDVLGGWIDLTIAEEFDSYTSQIKYDDLFVPEVLVAVVNITTGIIALPTDVQHLDLENIRFRPGNDSTLDYVLVNRRAWGENDGPPRYIIRDSSAANLGQVVIWPTAELAITDKLIINYWRKAIPPNADEALELVPDQLIPVIKKKVIARASLFGDSKQYAIFKAEAEESHSRSLGATNVGFTNG